MPAWPLANMILTKLTLFSSTGTMGKRWRQASHWAMEGFVGAMTGARKMGRRRNK